MKHPHPRRWLFALASIPALGACASLADRYESGSTESAQFRLVVSHAGPEAIGNVQNKLTGERWELPIQTTKTTYPRWTAARFDREHAWLLVPAEKALDRLLRDDCGVDRDDTPHCYSLIVVDLDSRRVIETKPLSKAETRRAGFIPD